MVFFLVLLDLGERGVLSVGKGGKVDVWKWWLPSVWGYIFIDEKVMTENM